MTEIDLPLVEMAYGSLVIAFLLVIRSFWIVVRWRRRYPRYPAVRATGWLLMATHMVFLGLLFMTTSVLDERGSLQDVAVVLDVFQTQVVPAVVALMAQWPEAVDRLPDLSDYLTNWLKTYICQTIA